MSSRIFGKPAVFFDRDGVITIPTSINGKGFAPRNLTDFRFYDDAISSLNKTRDAGFVNIVVSNQPDIDAGLLHVSVLKEMNNILLKQLSLDDVFNCHHLLEKKCNCRKPKPGMIIAAKFKHNIDLSKSWIIGDRNSDIQAGRVAGLRTVFIDRYWVDENGAAPDFRCLSLNEAVDFIISNNL